jgi:1-acyl-sn-glycerol-3-phosphate acyltransferase
MKAFFGRAVGKALEASGLTKEEFAYKVLPNFLLDLFTKYLRVNATGLEHIPKEGPVIVIGNHSGFMGFDALMLGHQVYLHAKRIPRLIAHKLWFFKPEIAVHAHKLGLVPATIDNGLKLLEKEQVLILFPEGEEGNFKPTRYRYRLRRFRRGFVRLALKTGAPIVPAIVIGAEETNITLSQIRWAKDLIGIIIPVPLNVVPLPAKWSIKFLPPIILKKDPEKAEDTQYVTHKSREIRIKLQKEIHKQLKKRDSIF